MIQAARISALLSLLFLAVYGSCNALSAHRCDVGVFYFEWEKQIPFVPWLILPYMSIDLFFVAAPFLLRRDLDRKLLALRIFTSIVIAAGCFLICPLCFAFQRPSAEGWLGAVFTWFQGMDQPYNQLPSLHIALLAALFAAYAKCARTWLRWGLFAWFLLIGISTVLTFQHHIMDVVGGLALAGVCFSIHREPSSSLPVIPNRRVGCYYWFGAFALLGAGLVLDPWGGWVLWPFSAMMIVGTAYWAAGPGVYQKVNGRSSMFARWILMPCRLGQLFSLWYYARQCRPYDAVTSNVWIGRLLKEEEARQAVKQGVGAVLDLTAEFEECACFRSQAYCNIPILDLTAPDEQQLLHMVDFIDKYSRSTIVYVHCKVGYSRSAAAVGSWLLATGQVRTVDEAVDRLRTVRPSIIVRPEIRRALEGFAQKHAGVLISHSL